MYKFEVNSLNLLKVAILQNFVVCHYPDRVEVLLFRHQARVVKLNAIAAKSIQAFDNKFYVVNQDNSVQIFESDNFQLVNTVYPPPSA